MSFPVVFHTQNYSADSGNPTVSSVYQPTPLWYHLKAFNLPSSHDIFRFKYHFFLHVLRFLFFFSDKIMTDVASKRQTTALFLSTIVTRTRRHTELTKNWQTWWGNLCCAREYSLQFFVQFLWTVKLHSLTYSVWCPLSSDGETDRQIGRCDILVGESRNSQAIINITSGNITSNIHMTGQHSHLTTGTHLLQSIFTV
jgi:hypothetical protein